jgi:hypothetical protein
MTNEQARLGELEGRFERMRLDLQEVQRQLITALQQIRDGQARYTAPGNGGGAGPFWCHSPGFAAGGGSWPSITCVTGTADIYWDQGGTMTLYLASQTVRWWYHDTSTSGKLVACWPTSDGNWQAVVDSCTGV